MKTISILLVPLCLLPALAMSRNMPGIVLTQGTDPLLPECPGTPNCVSSLAKDPAKKVAPFPVKGDPISSMELLTRIIMSSRRATVISSSTDRIVVEYRSLLGFVDDVLFALSPEGDVVHVRSASRKGSWDLGVNRRRVEKIRELYSRRAVKSPD